MFDCGKSIFKFVLHCMSSWLDWSWFICRLVLIYLLTFIFLKSSSNISLKRERAVKALLWKLVRLGKGEANEFKNMMLNPKAFSLKKYKKFQDIFARKVWKILFKVWKSNLNVKLQLMYHFANHINFFNKPFHEGPYTLIFMHVIGLSRFHAIGDWIYHWRFMQDYGLIRTWYSHTSLMFNEYLFHFCMFEFFVSVLKLILVKSKRFLIVLFFFRSDFYHSLFLNFVLCFVFQKIAFVFSWKKGYESPAIHWRLTRKSTSRKMNFCLFLVIR